MSTQATQEEKTEDPNKLNKKLKKRNNNWCHRNKKNPKKNYEQLYANKLDDLDEMGKFLKNPGLPKWSPKET